MSNRVDHHVDETKAYLKALALTAQERRCGGVSARMFPYRGSLLVGEDFYVPKGSLYRNEELHRMDSECFCNPVVMHDEYGTSYAHREPTAA